MILEACHLLGQVFPSFIKTSLTCIPKLFQLLRPTYIPVNGVICIPFVFWWLFSLKHYLIITMVVVCFEFPKIAIKSEKLH